MCCGLPSRRVSLSSSGKPQHTAHRAAHCRRRSPRQAFGRAGPPGRSVGKIHRTAGRIVHTTCVQPVEVGSSARPFDNGSRAACTRARQPRGGAPRPARRQLVLRLAGTDTPTLPPSSPYVRRAISDVFPLLERVRNGRHRRDKRHELEATSPTGSGLRSGRLPAPRFPVPRTSGPCCRGTKTAPATVITERGERAHVLGVVVVVSTETLARVIRPTDSTHQPGKPIFSGRYHRRFFAARRARGRDQRAIPRRPVFISRPTYVRPRGCWPRWSQALRIRPLQRGGTTESTTGPLHM